MAPLISHVVCVTLPLMVALSTLTLMEQPVAAGGASPTCPTFFTYYPSSSSSSSSCSGNQDCTVSGTQCCQAANGTVRAKLCTTICSTSCPTTFSPSACPYGVAPDPRTGCPLCRCVSKCERDLNKLAGDGKSGESSILTSGAFIPLCNADGTYARAQCSLSLVCRCVDSKTGVVTSPAANLTTDVLTMAYSKLPCFLYSPITLHRPPVQKVLPAPGKTVCPSFGSYSKTCLKTCGTDADCTTPLTKCCSSGCYSECVPQCTIPSCASTFSFSACPFGPGVDPLTGCPVCRCMSLCEHRRYTATVSTDSSTTFFPRCSAGDGSFEAIQCSSNETCWCVNTQTGSQLTTPQPIAQYLQVFIQCLTLSMVPTGSTVTSGRPAGITSDCPSCATDCRQYGRKGGYDANGCPSCACATGPTVPGSFSEVVTAQFCPPCTSACPNGFAPVVGPRGCSSCECNKPANAKVLRLQLVMKNLPANTYQALQVDQRTTQLQYFILQAKTLLSARFTIPAGYLQQVTASVATGSQEASLSFNVVGSPSSLDPTPWVQAIQTAVSQQTLQFTFFVDGTATPTVFTATVTEAQTVQVPTTSPSSSRPPTQTQSGASSSKTTATAVGVAVPVALLVLAGVIVLVLYQKKRATVGKDMQPVQRESDGDEVRYTTSPVAGAAVVPSASVVDEDADEKPLV